MFLKVKRNSFVQDRQFDSITLFYSTVLALYTSQCFFLFNAMFSHTPGHRSCIEKPGKEVWRWEKMLDLILTAFVD